MKAHQAAKKVIKELYPDIKVGITLSLHDMQPEAGGEDAAAKEWDEEFRHYLPYIADDDFFGAQSYTRQCFDAEGNKYTPDGVELTQMGYEFYPQAIANVVRAVAKDFKGDIIVTENGIATGRRQPSSGIYQNSNDRSSGVYRRRYSTQGLYALVTHG